MNQSYWEQDIYMHNIDVAVVGAGIVGLSVAIHLKMANPALKIVVIEKGNIMLGASLRNAGFACFGSPSELLDDITNRSEKEVFTLVEQRWKGLLALRKLLGDSAIELESLGGYEVFDSRDRFELCQARLKEFNSHLEAITGEKETFKVNNEKLASFGLKGFSYLIENDCEAQLNTGKMMQAYALKAANLGIVLLNGVNVINFSDNASHVWISTNWHNLKARRMLLATNGYTRLLKRNIDMVPARAQALITAPVPNLAIKGSFHYDRGYYFFRNVGNRLLLGGGRNLDVNGETTTEIETTERIQTALDKLLKERLLSGIPHSIDNRWSGIMGLGLHKSPIVEILSSNVFCAVRLGGMGVALGTNTGKDAAELVLRTL